jgi:hypothetical protein
MKNVKRKANTEIEFVLPYPPKQCVDALRRFETSSRFFYPIRVSVTKASRDTWYFNVSKSHYETPSWRKVKGYPTSRSNYLKVHVEGYFTKLANGSIFVGMTPQINPKTYWINGFFGLPGWIFGLAFFTYSVQFAWQGNLRAALLSLTLAIFIIALVSQLIFVQARILAQEAAEALRIEVEHALKKAGRNNHDSG